MNERRMVKLKSVISHPPPLPSSRNATREIGSLDEKRDVKLIEQGRVLRRFVRIMGLGNGAAAAVNLLDEIPIGRHRLMA